MPVLTPPITYHPDLFTGSSADQLEDWLKELAWVRRDTTPRMEYYVNKLGVPYTYGKGEYARTYEAQPTAKPIDFIWQMVEKHTNSTYEVCFLNRYLNQSDHLGWHSDNSPEMDDGRPIAIISFGVEREIWFRPTPTDCSACSGSGYYDAAGSPKCGACGGSGKKKTTVEKLLLAHGSLCLMAPGMQDTHQHRIPKSSRHCGERISLTFRGYKVPNV